MPVIMKRAAVAAVAPCTCGHMCTQELYVGVFANATQSLTDPDHRSTEYFPQETCQASRRCKRGEEETAHASEQRAKEETKEQLTVGVMIRSSSKFQPM